MPSNNPYPDLYDCRGLQIMYRDTANQLVTLPEFWSRDHLNYLIYVVEDLQDVTECLIPADISDLTSQCTVMLAYDSQGKIIADGWLRTSLLMHLCSAKGHNLLKGWQTSKLGDGTSEYPIIYELSSQQVADFMGPAADYFRSQGVSLDTSDNSRPALSIYLPKALETPVDPATCFALHTKTNPDQTQMFRELLAGFMDCAFSLTGKSIPVEYAPGTYPQGALDLGPEMVTPELLASAGLDETCFPTMDEAEFIYQQSFNKFPDGYIYNYLSHDLVYGRMDLKTLLVLRNEEGKIEMFTINKHRRQGFGFIDYLIRVPESKHTHLGSKMMDLLIRYARLRGWKSIALCHDSMSPFHDSYYRSLGFEDAPEYNCITSYVKH